MRREKGQRQEHKGNRGIKRKISTRELQAVCVAAGLLLYGVLKITAGYGGGSVPGEFRRAAHGEGEIRYEILVRGLLRENPEREITAEIPVRERQYTDVEADRVFEQALPELTEAILGDNSSLEEVRRDLQLPGRLESCGFKIQWESDCPEVLDSFGRVHNEEVTEAGAEVFLKASLTDGQYRRVYELRVTVLPPLLSEEERELAAFADWVEEADRGQEHGETLRLPQEYKGRKLGYRMKEETDYSFLPILGIVAAALLKVREKTVEQEEKRRREQQLLLDYSEVVSKLMVFIGAGMTIRGAWEKIVNGYEQGVKLHLRPVRFAYEEMCRTASQLRSGTSEGKAYGEFGRRCGLQPYIKLSALLEQNRKTGTKNLKSALELEMASAFGQRKNIARRLGEEAGTRLLLPLFLMLGIVMVMTVVPAFLAFY